METWTLLLVGRFTMTWWYLRLGHGGLPITLRWILIPLVRQGRVAHLQNYIRFCTCVCDIIACQIFWSEGMIGKVTWVTLTRMWKWTKQTNKFINTGTGTNGLDGFQNNVSIHLLSDLHLEIGRGEGPDYENFRITPKTDILALLGDIGTLNEDWLCRFLRQQTS